MCWLLAMALLAYLTYVAFAPMRAGRGRTRGHWKGDMG